MAARAYRFGTFRLDPVKRELRHGDELVPLPPKVFDCIAYLADNRERAVGRDELTAAVWGKADVSDNLLDQIMLRARRAVGDTNGERHVIRTIPRFGFSWVAPIETETSLPPSAGRAGARSDASATLSEAAPASATAVASRPLLAGLAAVLLLAAVTLGVGVSRKPVLGSAAARPPGNVALVLPVTVEAGSEHAWVRLGVMDFIAARLRAVGQAVIPSDNTVALAQGSDGRDLDDTEVRTLATTATASLLIDTRAEASNGGWRVTLRTRYGHTPALTAEAEASNVLDAARAAADDLISALGLSADSRPAAPGDAALAEVIQKAKAALLANRLDDARALLDRAVSAQHTPAEVLYLSGQIDLNAGRYSTARERFTVLTEAVSGADDPVMRGRALYGIGFSYFRNGDEVSAGRYFDQAVALLETSRATEASSALGRVLTLRAANQFMRGDVPAAESDFARARILLESCSDQIGLVSLDNNAGVFAVDQDRYAEAVSFLERAVRRAESVHDVASELRARIGIARAQLGLLEPAAALAGEARLRELAALASEPQLKQFVGAWRAQVLAANGHLQAANELLREALAEEFESANDASGLALATDARLAWERGDFERAAASADAALKLRWDAQDPRQYGLTWLVLLRGELAQHELEASAATAATAATWAERLAVPPVPLYATLAKAEHAAATGADAAALEAFTQAWSAAQARRVPFDLLQAARSYLGYLISKGDLVTASVVAGRVAAWADRDYDAAIVQLRLYHALGEATAWRGALAQARKLAGERAVPPELLIAPASRL
jgi:DNA-binding winged helix-turn-helix (wHTH) protein/tetratricopeptide (TPR) repeat protein